MMPSFEALLVVGIVGFYLYDSAMLLYSNELVYVKTLGRWSFVKPATHWQLMGRFPHVPNPLTPNQFMLRVIWNRESSPVPENLMAELQEFTQVLKPLHYLTVLLLATLLFSLPIVLLRWGTGTIFMALVLLSYLNVVIMLMFVYRKRDALRITGKTFRGLAFESLACVPFAINLVRKISLQYPFRGGAIEFAQQAFSAQIFGRLIQALLSRIDEELAIEDEDSRRARDLCTYRACLSSLQPE